MITEHMWDGNGFRLILRLHGAENGTGNEQWMGLFPMTHMNHLKNDGFKERESGILWE